MNKKIKKLLSDVTPRPDYIRKDAVIRMCQRRSGEMMEERGLPDIVISQIAYIRAPVWIISAAALIVAIWGLYSDKEIVYAVSALMPFVSGIAVFESLRSRTCGMSEMEGATLVSLRGMLFARIVCVGASHIILLTLLSVIVGSKSGYGFMMTGAMLTAPYLLTSIGSMELERMELGRKNIFGCMAVSAAASILMIFLQNERSVFAENYRWIWYIAIIMLVIIECYEIKRVFKWEDYAWN